MPNKSGEISTGSEAYERQRIVGDAVPILAATLRYLGYLQPEVVNEGLVQNYQHEQTQEFIPQDRVVENYVPDNTNDFIPKVTLDDLIRQATMEGPDNEVQ